MLARTHLRQVLIGGAATVAALVGLPADRSAADTLFTATGALTDVLPGGALDTELGLQVGDLFIASALYDETLLTNMSSQFVTLDPNVNPGSSFDLNIANLLFFDQTADIEFGDGTFPLIRFFDGKVVGFDFIAKQFDINGTPYNISLDNSQLFIRNLADLVTEAQGEISVSQSIPVTPLTQ